MFQPGLRQLSAVIRIVQSLHYLRILGKNDTRATTLSGCVPADAFRIGTRASATEGRSGRFRGRSGKMTDKRLHPRPPVKAVRARTASASFRRSAKTSPGTTSGLQGIRTHPKGGEAHVRPFSGLSGTMTKNRPGSGGFGGFRFGLRQHRSPFPAFFASVLNIPASGCGGYSGRAGREGR